MALSLAYQKLACRTLGLVHSADRASYRGMLLELGSFRVIESDAALDAVIERYLRTLQKQAQEVADGYWEKQREIWDADPERDERNARLERLDRRAGELLRELDGKTVLTYRDFRKFNGHGDAERARFQREPISWRHSKNPKSLVYLLARQKLAQAALTRGVDSNRAGYRTYLKFVNRKMYDLLNADLPALVPEEPRSMHTYMTAAPGSGKTELLKALCLQYVNQPDYAGLVVLDPGGDAVQQIARWPQLIPSGRLVYIDPTLDPKQSPVINPFDADHLGDRDRALLTDQIVAAIGTLIEGKAGGELSVNMETVLVPAVRLLVDLPGATLEDLKNLMTGDPRLIALGARSAKKMVREFFSGAFQELSNLATTKQSIEIKLRNILSRDALSRMLCGRTSIDLERLMAERKVILVNLSKGKLGEAESKAIGTFLLSLMLFIATKRARIPRARRPVTHAVVDECQNFVTKEIKTIIREARKFGLPITLVQQSVGDEMPADLEKVVVGSTNVKIAGRSEITETRRTAELVDTAPEEIKQLKNGQFMYRNGSAPTFLLRVRSDYADEKGGVNAATWREILKQQRRFYYQAPEARQAKWERPDDSPKDDEKTRAEQEPSGKKKYNFR